jgi:hypothetical protein
MQINPFIGTSTAPVTPVPVQWNRISNSIYLTNANSITGSHNRSNIMRVKYIFHYNGEVVLPFGKYFFNAGRSFRSHKKKIFVNIKILVL